jgi:predicted Rossmann fold nucleotide-binding protein DprA/Smf involved in DNA uptake
MLYDLGPWELAEHRVVAVVGTRNVLSEGAAREPIERNHTIVSGLA